MPAWCLAARLRGAQTCAKRERSRRRHAPPPDTPAHLRPQHRAPNLVGGMRAGIAGTGTPRLGDVQAKRPVPKWTALRTWHGASPISLGGELLHAPNRLPSAWHVCTAGVMI